MTIEYFGSVVSSMLREITPILLVTLCACFCSKVCVFNIALEGTLLISAFVAYITQYFVHNIIVSILAAVCVAMLITFIMSFFIVHLKGQPMIVGMAINTFSLGFTTFLLQAVFNTKGVAPKDGMTGLTKLQIPALKKIPFLDHALADMTAIDYLAFVIAIICFIIMYKTVVGFRLRAIGINASAAKSLGIKVERYQIISVTLSGAMIGLAGCLLTLASPYVLQQNISGARGYISLAANALALNHPLGAILSSTLFGFTKALCRMLQNTAIKQQLLECIPYTATIIAMVVYNLIANHRRKKH